MTAQVSDRLQGDPQQSALPVAEAARILGITASALRNRIRRGKVDAFKDEAGRLFVYIESVEPAVPESPLETDAADEVAVETPEETDATSQQSPLDLLTGELHRLSEQLKSQDAFMDRVIEMCRQQVDSDSEMKSAMRALAQHIETLTQNVRTLGAGFRLHSQELDRLFKSLSRSQSGAQATTAPVFTPPPTQKPRIFGRKFKDQEEDADIDPVSSE